MGRIHPGAQEYFKSQQDDAEIIRPFLTCFDVTAASRKTDGGEVAAFYLKPEKFISELIGIDREILLVYAPHREFQARTIKINDLILSRERIRLDPMGSIIISNDPSTKELVQDYLLKEPEHPTIVALSRIDAQELKSADDVRRVLVQQFFRRDLFALESPLTVGTTFFGRTEIITELLDRFRAGQNSGLFGLRRIGKTSALFALGRRCQESRIGGFAYLDLSGPARYRSRWWALLQAIARSIIEILNPATGRAKLHALAENYTEENGSHLFREDMKRLRNKFSNNRFLLALDEIENITFDISPSPHWNEDFLPFWQTMRSLHQDTEGEFCFIVAGVNPRALEAYRVGNFDNPLFSTAKAYYLPPFELPKVREMVRRLARYMGLKCEEALYQRLTEDYGGHPFLVRQACSQLAKKVQDRPGQMTTRLFERDRAHLSLMLEKNVRQILHVLAVWYPDEYELISDLAKGKRETFVEFANLDAEFTQHMEGYGLVKDARSDPRISIGLVENFLKKEPTVAGTSGEPEDLDREQVEAEIARRRNAIERRLRQTVLTGLRFKYGRKAANAALSAFTPERKAVLANFSYDEMWDHTYFNELAQVLSREWEVFQNWFGEDKDVVLRWLDQVNRSRADAHAREISAEDVAYLRICFRRLEENLGLV